MVISEGGAATSAEVGARLLFRLSDPGDHLLPIALLVRDGDLVAGLWQRDLPALEDVGLTIDDDLAGLLVGPGDDPGHLRLAARLGKRGTSGPRDGAEEDEATGGREEL